MDWYEEFNISNFKFQIYCLPSRHFSNRLLGKRNQTLWASFMVEAGGRKVYIGGDGGYDKRFAEIHERFGAVDLALLENGQYNANWKYIHTTPEDLEKVILDLQAKQVFTVHHDKFSLSLHPWYEPDSVAHDIATRHHIHLLDAPIPARWSTASARSPWNGWSGSWPERTGDKILRAPVKKRPFANIGERTLLFFI